MNRSGWVWLSGVALLFSSLNSAAASEAAPTRVGRQVDDFLLRDFRGAEHSLDALLDDHELVVVAFLGVECPLVKLYAPRLAELAAEFGDRGVAFVAVDSNAQDSVTEMGYAARDWKMEFPFLKDPGNRVADQFDAIRTPEIFVVDRSHCVRYWGRVDDQYGFQTGVGYARPEITRRDLATALEELLAGQEVSVARTDAPGCRIGRVHPPKADAPITYSRQIARILQDNCVSCHRPGEIAPFALTDYDEVVGWAEMIDEVVHAQRMPPWQASAEFGDFANDCRLSDEAKAMIHRWVEDGAPQGDPADLPEPKQFTVGWQIPEPDQVVYMSDESFVVPAQGTVEYQYFVVDPGFTEDKWVRAAECRPGNRSVVHHIIVFLVEPGQDIRQLGEGRGTQNLLAGTAPGNPPTVMPPGFAQKVKAGTKLLFQMHYTANGTPQPDRSSIGLVFADPSEVRREVRTDLAINPFFEIPAGASNWLVESQKTIRRDGVLISLMPHMHLRGKAFRYELVGPDGSKETLLDIPNYDFNWQNSYYFREPKVVRAGSKIRCYARFDNSAENLANPDPNHPVAWGDQTWEEMMIGWFVISPDPKSTDSPEAEPSEPADDEVAVAADGH